MQELGERVISPDILAQTPPVRHRLYEWLRAAEHQPSVMSTRPALGQGGDGAVTGHHCGPHSPLVVLGIYQQPGKNTRGWTPVDLSL